MRLGVLVISIVIASATLARAAGGDVELVSRAAGVDGAAGNGGSVLPDTVPDGHVVAFASSATNLTADAIPAGGRQAFVRDIAAGSTVLASRANGPGGVVADTDVDGVAVSDDGNRVVFHTRATNLVPGATTALDRVYVRDIAAGTTTLLEAATGDDGVRPAISGDGRWAAFASRADYAGATGVSLKVYVRDLQAPAAMYELVSRETGAAGATTFGDRPALSRDGRVVAFKGNLQVLVRDRRSATTVVASAASGVGAP